VAHMQLGRNTFGNERHRRTEAPSFGSHVTPRA
jgi:hypothetical protein